QPARCLAIENAPLGVRSAVTAGIPTWGLLIGSPLRPSDLAREGARQVFTGHEQLLDALRAGTGLPRRRSRPPTRTRREPARRTG
ncbi:hypothetical protein JXB37_03815, partial [candidate division WOR-3 bacterium]|nr:hypothetical protein [candidate division WOR-3 bacterium]